MAHSKRELKSSWLLEEVMLIFGAIFLHLATKLSKLIATTLEFLTLLLKLL